jgi:hypothetical protein
LGGGGGGESGGGCRTRSHSTPPEGKVADP